jgi:hypothetical protein
MFINLGSRLEGKSDLRVNLKDEWIYFEITCGNSDSPDNSILIIVEIASYTGEGIKRHDLLPGNENLCNNH